jgi:periplasmic divalent cation tolerance protein
MTNQIVVLVTCGSSKEAEEIGRALVERKLAACANILRSPVRSIYRWKNKVELANEVLMILKSSRSRFAALDRAIRGLHSYDLPEIVALPITKGSRGYLDWISRSVSGRPTKQVARSSAR